MSRRSRMPLVPVTIGVLVLMLLASPPAARAQFEMLLHADFESETPGQPIPLGGPELGEPTWANSFQTSTVEDGVMPTRCLVMQDTDLNSLVSGMVGYELVGGVNAGSDLVTVEMDLQFDPLEDYFLSLTDHPDASGMSHVTYAIFNFDHNGSVYLYDAANGQTYLREYPADTVIHLAVKLDFTRGVYRVLWDGTPEITGRALPDGPGLGGLFLGTKFDQDTAGRFAVDNITVSRAPVAAAAPTWSGVKALYR